MKYLGITLVVLPILSAFLWSAFDIRWWIPTEQHDARELGLAALHACALYVGSYMAVFGESK